MATTSRLRKKIVTTGTYMVSRPDGTRAEEVITLDRLNHWANSFNDMRSQGIRLPCPSIHTDKAKPLPLSQTSHINYQNAPVLDSFNNLGFWDRLWVVGDALFGEVEAIGNIHDTNTPAGKLGTSIREVSISTIPAYIDGKGQTYNDVIGHIAGVVHPIEQGQDNFEPMTLGIAMSNMLPQTKPTDTKPTENQNPSSQPLFKRVIEALRNKNIEVGDDATPDNLFDRIVIACSQPNSSPSENTKPEASNPLTKPLENGKTQPVSVAMSTVPTTPALTAEDINTIRNQNALLMSCIRQQQQATFNTRIQALATKGFSAEVIAELTALAPATQMSIGSNGLPEPSMLDRMLSILEKINLLPALPATPTQMSYATPTAAVAQPQPNAGQAMTVEQMTNLADSMARSFGISFGAQ